MLDDECCICMNEINETDLFILECCNNRIHHECLISWINTNIKNKLPDYNKCILCKKHNSLIDDYYNNIRYNYNLINNSNDTINQNSNADISNTDVVLLIEHNNSTINNRNITTINYLSVCICSGLIGLMTYFIFYNVNN